MITRITSAAWQDLRAIGDWIAHVDPAASTRLTDDLLDRASDIGDAPLRYPVVPSRADLRKRSHRSHVIIYRVTTEIEVLRILDARRDYIPLLDEL